MSSSIIGTRDRLHAFVVMRDHFHALLTIEGKGTIEGAVGRIKGGFSYRAKRELGFTKEIWQPGFTDERVWDAEQFCAVAHTSITIQFAREWL